MILIGKYPKFGIILKFCTLLTIISIVMSKSTLLLYLTPFLISLSASTPPFSELQGFGAYMPIKIFNNIVVVD